MTPPVRRLHFDDRFEQIVVQVPRDAAVSAAGLRASTAATANALPTHGVGDVVGGFFSRWQSLCGTTRRG